jgi:hypothetical protein
MPPSEGLPLSLDGIAIDTSIRIDSSGTPKPHQQQTSNTMSLAWDILQHYQIEKAKTAAEIASMKIDSLSARKDNTKQELEELTLACQAMWELLRDHLGFTDAHLKAKILEIDARDGVVDGKIGAEVVDCPHCGQKASTTKPNCMYCGNRLPDKHVMK